MKTLYGMILVIVLIVLLVACREVTPANNPISTPLPISETSSQVTENLPTSTFTTRPYFTPLPSNTPDLTKTASSQSLIFTHSAEQTLSAQYPHFCKDTLTPQEYSPNGVWLVELCYSENDNSPVLTFSNKETQTLYKLLYIDYISPGLMPDSNMTVFFWSPDQSYAYFGSFPIIDGGECFVGRNSEQFGGGLFRIDLQTGAIATILPPENDFRSYDFSFSPTGRRLIYQFGSSDLVIRDIKSGQSIRIQPTNKKQIGGGYLWSLDGLKFIYSTVSYGDNGPIEYSLRLVDSQSGSERVLLESSKDCFVATEWMNNQITVERYDEQYNQMLIDFDLNSNQIISQVTATPRP